MFPICLIIGIAKESLQRTFISDSINAAAIVAVWVRYTDFWLHHRYVKLLRGGLSPVPSEEIRKAVFDRLVQKLLVSDVRQNLLNYLRIDPNRVTTEVIANGVQPVMSLPHGEPHYAMVYPEDFLMHIRPDPQRASDVRLDWDSTWKEIRERYAEGRL